MKSKTLLAIKIRASKKAREASQLLLLTAGLLAFLAFIGALQYGACQRDHPGRAVRECFRWR